MLCAHCEKLMFCSPSCDPRVLGRSLFFLQLALYGPTIPSTVLFELRESWGMRIKPLLSQVRGPRGGKWDLTSCLATAMDSPQEMHPVVHRALGCSHFPVIIQSQTGSVA